MVHPIYILTTLCLIVFLLLLMLFIQQCIKIRYLNKLTANIPSYPCLPFIGILNKLLNLNCEGVYKIVVDILDNSSETLKRSPVKLWIGLKFCILIGKPEYLQTIYTSSSSIEKTTDFYTNLRDILGERSFLYKPASQWKPHRKIFQTVFTNTRCFTKVHDMGIICTEYLKEKEIQISNKDVSFTNVSEMLYVLTAKMVCFYLMGTNAVETSKVSKYVKGIHMSFDTAFQRMFKLWLHFDFIFKFSNQYKLQKYYQDQCNEFTTWYVENRREKRSLKKMNQNKSTHDEDNETCLLDLILDLEESGELTPQEVKYECFLFFSAGVDTTSFSTHVALLMIAMHADVQEKLYEEIQQVLGDSKRSIEAEDIKQMKYLEMVIKETLRLYTPIPITGRSVTENIQLDDFTIPAGSIIAPSPYAVHHNSDIYPEPERFYPERFQSENKIRPYTFLPFSGGSRNCIGYSFAYLMMKLSICEIVRQYKLTTQCKHSDIKIELILTAALVDAKSIIFEARS